MSYLAFDLGGSGGKLFLGHFSGGRLTIEEVHRFKNKPVDINGGLYWDIINIYDELVTGINKAAERAGDKIISLGIDSFCNDFALVSKTGELLSPVRCYRDSRTELHKGYIYGIMSPRALYMKNGNQIAPFNALMELGAMIAAGQKYMLDGAFRLLFVPDLLANFLTGEFHMEYTLASVSQMFSYETGQMDGELLDTFGIPRHLFAPVTQPGAYAGHIKDGLAKQNGISVCTVCGHDTASAFLAAQPGSLIMSSGTWSLMGYEAASPNICSFGFEKNIANEGGPKGHHRILKNVMGSWLMQCVRAEFEAEGVDASFETVAEAVSSAEPFRHFIDVDDMRFYAPRSMRRAIDESTNERYGSHPKDLGGYIRCIAESLAMKYRIVADDLEELRGSAFDTLNIIGGGCNDAFLCGLTACATGKRVLAGPAEATAIGNIIMQLIADKKISSVEEGRCAALGGAVEYLPQDRELWDRQFARFRVETGC